MLQMFGSSAGRSLRSSEMTSAVFDRLCQCCGAPFVSSNPIAKWCHVNCRVQAYQCRKRGEPVRPARNRAWFADSDAQPIPGHAVRDWQGTAITRRNSDGYVNATAMCQANGKRWPDYFRGDRTTAYIKSLAASTGIHWHRLAMSDTTGRNELRGTWVHPSLAVDLARWISPAFAVWMDDWFLQSSTPGAMPEPVKVQPLPTRTTPLIGPRPTDAELASQLRQEASETLESIQFELELFNDPSTPPLVKAIAQEFNATAHRLTKLAAALTAVA
jgi:hypothetical protein